MAAFRLGLIGLIQFVPLFALTLVTGWAADRVDRRWIAFSASWMAMCIIAYIRDSCSGLSSGAIQAAMAASVAVWFQARTSLGVLGPEPAWALGPTSPVPAVTTRAMLVKTMRWANLFISGSFHSRKCHPRAGSIRQRRRSGGSSSRRAGRYRPSWHSMRTAVRLFTD